LAKKEEKKKGARGGISQRCQPFLGNSLLTFERLMYTARHWHRLLLCYSIYTCVTRVSNFYIDFRLDAKKNFTELVGTQKKTRLAHQQQHKQTRFCFFLRVVAIIEKKEIFFF
jgi:hypothetical protein